MYCCFLHKKEFQYYKTRLTLQKILKSLYEQHFNNIILYKLKDIQLNNFRIVASILASLIND